MWMLVFAACDRGGPLTTQASWDAPALDQVLVVRSGQDPTPIGPESAFAAKQACPVITSARFVQDDPPLGELSLEGTGLERVGQLHALNPDGTKGAAPPYLTESGVRFPVGCTTCTLLLVFEVEDQRVACTGPGYSLGLEFGRLTE
jgi:hypothetical protein